MRNLVHVLVSIAMWCLFGYYWYVVLGREVGPETVRAMFILLIGVVAGLIVTMLWIGHNLRLARKFEGRRRGFQASAGPPLEQDTIGRPVTHPGLAALRDAACIDITADETTKTYQVATDRQGP